jgi:hypothetical protein
MYATAKLKRQDARRRFQARKLRRMFESEHATIEELARAIDDYEGLRDHLRSALPEGVHDGGRTDELLCRIGVREAESLIKRYWGRGA